MLYRLRREFRVRAFDRAIGAVHETPPMPVVEAPLSIVSMVNETDLTMYLLTMKAFYRRLGRGRLVAIIPRAMPAAARATLERHFPGIALQPIEDIDVGPCQRGGCWERLLYIVARSAEEYVLQVDSDVLAIDATLEEIAACVAAGTPFTLVDGVRRILPLPEISAAAHRMQTDYIGVVAEQLLERYPDAANLRYVRGSAALAGFARGGISRAAIETFHETMAGLVGPRWREWGTEQCASNFAIANSPGATLLPHPAYTSFFPGGPREGVKLFHFMGSHRFEEGVFARHARAELAALQAMGRPAGRG
jgi:hypothetical protein